MASLVASSRGGAVGFGVIAVLGLTHLIVGTSAASALPLPPSSSVFPLPLGIGTSGGVVIASQTLPFSTSLYSGTLTSQVISGDTNNPHGGLTFTFLLSNDARSSSSLNRLTLNGFTNAFSVDASWFGSSPNIAPFAVDRDGTGVVGFSFNTILPGFLRIAPGTSSTLLILQTNSTTYFNTLASVIDGRVTQVGSFAPVPTPGVASLLGLGGALAVRRRRR
jgi:MYXO-CTERM domain-containing protein